MLELLKTRARSLKNETYAIYLAAKDPRTPWYVKILVLFIAAYALSPIDLIPDFIPILGYLDDLVLIPAGLALAIKLVPAEVLEDAREKVKQTEGPEGGVGLIGTLIIILLWIMAIIITTRFVLIILKDQ